MPEINLYLGDSLEAMRGMKDNQYSLAIVDPPYGIDINSSGRLGHYGGKGKKWDSHIPSQEYFNELVRVSTNQIVWGGNYFPLPPTKCFLIWDKMQPEGVSFASCEFAWSSFTTVAKTFRQRPQGENRIHPTQKPAQLYRWLLKNYANPGDTILDTHLGSGSIALACHDMGFDLDAWEIDPDYHKAACKRFEQHKRQLNLEFA